MSAASSDSRRFTASASSAASAENEGNIKVFVRVRPSSRREQETSSEHLVSPISDNSILLHPREQDKAEVKKASHTSTKSDNKKFSFDKCIWSIDPNSEDYSDQHSTYNLVGEEMLQNALEGYNSCIMAYGQTGSGKTYTMMGKDSDPGLIPNLCHDLFDKIKYISENENVKFKVQLSFFEIYQEMVRDLLNDGGNNNNTKLKVREGKDKIPYVESLTEVTVSSYKDIEKLLLKGTKNRTTAATNMNDESSRSHSILTVKLTQEKFLDNSLKNCAKLVSHLRLVDLAGSERSSASGDNKLRQREGSQINKSLTTLGRILTILSDISSKRVKRDTVVPYRESILTWLLKESIGGNSKTAMVACISPCDYEETLSTLRYATITAKIENQAKLVSSETTSFDVTSIVAKYENEREELLNYIELLKNNSENENDMKVKKLENYINYQHEYISSMNFRNSVMVKNLEKSNKELLETNQKLSLLSLNQNPSTTRSNKSKKTNEVLEQLKDIKDKLINDSEIDDLQNELNVLITDENSLVNKYLIEV